MNGYRLITSPISLTFPSKLKHLPIELRLLVSIQIIVQPKNIESTPPNNSQKRFFFFAFYVKVGKVWTLSPGLIIESSALIFIWRE